MKDYYMILGIDINNDITNEIILNCYKNKISRFVGLPFLTKQMIIDIKNIKEARYVLTHILLKDRYITKFKKFKQLADDERYIDNTKICDRLFSIKFGK